ncbi:MAG: penicillin-insensitive murein endopeptidase [Myxococcales bacterium]|nr:penicillin-insensitive murein endopeptidase [Myxococcales bacterium]
MRCLMLSLVAGLALAASACVELGVVGDGTTVSVGGAADGVLLDGAELPDRGVGYEVPARWRARGSQWGTDELVALVVGAGRRVAEDLPGARIGVADMSRRGGGPGPHHRSHQTGRDVDLLFFVRDPSGRPVALTEMRHFGDEGRTVDGGPPLRFDVARTWVLVRALLADRGVVIDHLFIYAPLRSLLLDHARAIGEPEGLVAWAGQVLSQPGDSAPHDDHLHVRIRCPLSDGLCVDGGRARVKKARAIVAARVATTLAAHPIVGSPWLRGPRW